MTTDFVASTYEMIHEGRGIRFTPVGDAAEVFDFPAFKSALRKHFGHSNPASFYRSCSNYGIYRSSSPCAVDSQRGCTVIKHPFLRAGCQDLLHLIQRGSKLSSSTSSGASSPHAAHARISSPCPSSHGDRPLRLRTSSARENSPTLGVPRGERTAGHAVGPPSTHGEDTEGYAPVTAPVSIAPEPPPVPFGEEPPLLPQPSTVPQSAEQPFPKAAMPTSTLEGVAATPTALDDLFELRLILPPEKNENEVTPTALDDLFELRLLLPPEQNEDDVPPPPCPTDDGPWLGAGRTPWPPVEFNA